MFARTCSKSLHFALVQLLCACFIVLRLLSAPACPRISFCFVEIAHFVLCFFARSFHPNNVFGRQVLGRALGRVVQGQVTLAWKAELKAREHETRLLQELEVIQFRSISLSLPVFSLSLGVYAWFCDSNDEECYMVK